MEDVLAEAAATAAELADISSVIYVEFAGDGYWNLFNDIGHWMSAEPVEVITELAGDYDTYGVRPLPPQRR